MKSEIKPNILIVDDDATSLSLLETILKELDVVIIKALSGHEALSKIEDQEIALTLLDVNMPDMNGIELAEIIQNDENREKVPIIFITSHVKKDLELEKCYKSGAVDFILKPVVKFILLSKVKLFLELYRQKKQILKDYIELEKTKHDKVLLAQVEKASHTGSWRQNINSGHIRWSDEMYKIFDLDENLNNENLLDVFINAIHPYDKNRIEKILAKNITGAIFRVMNYRIVRGDGSIRSVHALWGREYSDSGQLIAQFGFLQDITEQKIAENTIKESEKMYRTLLNASPEGIFIMDLKGRITEISDIILEIFGAGDKSEFIGVPFFNFIPSTEVQKMKEILSNAKSEGLIQNIEFILTRKNQSQFICELSITLIQEADGRPDAYMAIIRDISQRKKIEQQLNRSERMASLGEMASGMAHEINQPLLSITLGIENLFMKIENLKAVDESYFNKKSEKIFEDILRIGRIIDHVRAFSRDHDEYISTSFDINESINNAISMISEQFKHHGITLDLQLDNNIPSIIGNTYRFEQVILNLLTNAKDTLQETKKTSKSDFKKTIVIRTYHDDYSNFIEVKDNGNGIKPEVIERIMLPFYTTKSASKGTGLGLSISFGIIKELKGSIDVESNPESGTTFKISVPIPEIKDNIKITTHKNE
ncbi:sensory box sensor histidine kinase [Polaribacter irgensii 23-P]|uniref:histidine kinase n=1 Tax=Polaribacter irgensii 23-P TaxID=313594 RepID=A4BWF2_9FLAO|nr:hybrid sensor histidine kinase/response regulator [Polaribacter irgensii]EAR13293.1 sensory box sensor histidine kinase [Polaribacter irgensii 23-P]